jgi:hypothetical protein
VLVPTNGSIQPGSTIEYYTGDVYQSSAESFNQGAGSLNFNNDVDLSGGGEYVWNLSSLSVSSPGTNFDQVLVGGNVALGGASKLTLDFSLLGAAGPDSADAFWDASHSWKIVDTATNTGNTNFASLINGTFANGTFSTSVGSAADAGDIFLNFSIGGGGVQGDYNNDGKVDAADYVVWRQDPDAHGGNPAGYTAWRSNFGSGTGAGGGLAGAAVPEPVAIAYLVSISGIGWLRRTRA